MDSHFTPSDDVVRELEKENRERKSTARSAKNRVVGSKSKHCSLPCDALTPGQLKALNGPVEAYNLKAPMSWSTFNSMPEDLRTDYLRYLKANYAPTDDMLAEMFGVSHTSVYKMRLALGFPSNGRGYRPGKGALLAWKMFLHPDSDEAPTTEGTEEADTVLMCAQDSPCHGPAVSGEADAREPEPVAEAATDTRLSAFSLSFNDVRSWEELYALLTNFPRPGAGSKLTLCVEIERE